MERASGLLFDRPTPHHQIRRLYFLWKGKDSFLWLRRAGNETLSQDFCGDQWRREILVSRRNISKPRRIPGHQTNSLSCVRGIPGPEWVHPAPQPQILWRIASLLPWPLSLNARLGLGLLQTREAPFPIPWTGDRAGLSMGVWEWVTWEMAPNQFVLVLRCHPTPRTACLLFWLCPFGQEHSVYNFLHVEFFHSAGTDLGN